MIKRLWQIIGGLITLSAFVGIIIGFNGYFAKAADVKAIEKRLDQKILIDKADSVQARIWKLEDRYKGKPMPQDILDQYRFLKQDLNNTDRDLRKK
jgi:hypothetical protein